MHVCRQCAETKLWIIMYMRSGKDDKPMMCTCVDNMANDMDNVHLCRQCAETKLYMIGYIKSTRDDMWMTSALSVRKEYIKDHCKIMCALYAYAQII